MHCNCLELCKAVPDVQQQCTQQWQQRQQLAPVGAAGAACWQLYTTCTTDGHIAVECIILIGLQ
jgi:hypothetical protein